MNAKISGREERKLANLGILNAMISKPNITDRLYMRIIPRKVADANPSGFSTIIGIPNLNENIPSVEVNIIPETISKVSADEARFSMKKRVEEREVYLVTKRIDFEA